MAIQKQLEAKNPNKQRNLILSAIAVAALIITLIFAEAWWGRYVVRILNLCAIYAICALAMNLVNGFTGLFTLGNTGFMAIGAYTTALLVMTPEAKAANFYLEPIVPFLADIQIPFLPALIMGGLLAAAAAFLIGFPVLRLKGDYLAIATLGFSEIIRILITNAQSLTNGSLGLKNISVKINLWWTFIPLAVVTVFMLLMMKTSYGRALKAIREDEIAAESMGISLFSHKMLAFILSGFFAGVAGGLLGALVGAVDPLQFRFIQNYTILLMVVLGGLGSISGSIVGAFIVTIAQEALRFMDEPIELIGYPGIAGMRMVVFSLMLILIILFWSRGLFGTNEFGWDWLIDGCKSLFGKLTGKSKKTAGGDAK